jgi:serine/threonine protein phosphatase PrpC
MKPSEEEVVLTTASTSKDESLTPEQPLSLPCVLPSLPRGRCAALSEEEDSVAEMDYMSEGSNLSVKGAIPALSADSTEDDDSLRDLVPLQAGVSFSTKNADNNTDFEKAISRAVVPADAKPPTSGAAASPFDPPGDCHRPRSLPTFRDPQKCVWTASHAANCPTEDRSAMLVNLLLQPLPPDSEQTPVHADYSCLIRLNLWCVVDGHGGGCVATYASEVLLPHLAASVSTALHCAVVDRGVCLVNGQLRDATALDLDGLITTTTSSTTTSTTSTDDDPSSTSCTSNGSTPNSIHYRSPFEREAQHDVDAVPRTTALEHKQLASMENFSLARENEDAKAPLPSASGSSVMTSVKSVGEAPALVGAHSPQEVAAITRAITESFLAVDEGWINSIDPVATHQNSCQSNGRWNSGACALVVFTVQRLDWTTTKTPTTNDVSDRDKGLPGQEEGELEQGKTSSLNQDAARRRMLDYAVRAAKSASCLSTVSSTGSGPESEITETDEEDERLSAATVRRNPNRSCKRGSPVKKASSIISPPGGCSCHCYRPHDAMLYTAHVGDCRAVMLGSAPPRTIKFGGITNQDMTDDESSHHSSDETECLSSSDHDADSSEEEDVRVESGSATSTATSSYLNVRRVVRQKSSRCRTMDDSSGPFIPLPPQKKTERAMPLRFDIETEIASRERRSGNELSDSSTCSQDTNESLKLILLSPVTSPIDLTTDHSAYNPAEVTAVLRRCNNAPRAISAGVGGGIKRVAGSLAVTRALGDAYLKTPLLSFLPYKSHAPYITGRPEVNCRRLLKEGDKVLILATDGVWGKLPTMHIVKRCVHAKLAAIFVLFAERAGGEDCLRWVRNFFDERSAEAERRNNRRSNVVDKVSSAEEMDSNAQHSQEGTERDLFERNDAVEQPARGKREPARSPSPTAKRRKRGRQHRMNYNVADVIVRRVLNKVRRARNISTLQALMSLPQGRARRSKHDDITASVVDLSEFIS